MPRTGRPILPRFVRSLPELLTQRALHFMEGSGGLTRLTDIYRDPDELP